MTILRIPTFVRAVKEVNNMGSTTKLEEYFCTNEEYKVGNMSFELQKLAIRRAKQHNPNYRDDYILTRSVYYLFTWVETKEGHQFWEDVDRGKVTEIQDPRKPIKLNFKSDGHKT